jgi:O-antigen/teichoic acid export membrane protein
VDDGSSLRKIAAPGVAWSIVQNWGGKLFTFLLSILLARILSPEEFGIASAAWLALMLVPMVAELGFSEAVMQRRGLRPSDVNLPFYLSSALAFVLVGLAMLMSGKIAVWAGLEGRETYVIAIAATILLSVPTTFQEAAYKRNLRFRELAMRAFASNIFGGIAALACALAGMGVWAFVVQAYVVALVNVIWIWSHPQWLPGKELDFRAFREMFRYSGPVLTQRLLDFAGTRIIDLMIVTGLGPVAYGIYVVGSRLYQTRMQLLQGAFNDVSITVLSTVAHDRDRLANAYCKTISLAATAMAPVFVLFGALAPEICNVLFGTKWAGVDSVAQPLLLMGAVNCVQYINGPFLSSRGKPELILITGTFKTLVQVCALLAFSLTNVADATKIFVIATLSATPLSFAMVARELGLTIGTILRLVALPTMLAAFAFAAVHFGRTEIASYALPVFWQGVLLGGLFSGIYLCMLAVFDRQKTTAFVGLAGNFARRVKSHI